MAKTPKIGRPLKFKSPEELQKKIDAYFEHCDNTIIKIQHPFSKGITTVKTSKPYDIAGLASFLDTNRQTLLNYQAQEPYFDVISRAKERIEADIVAKSMLGIYNPKIAALNLASNYNYSEKQDIDVKKTLEITMSDDDLDRAIESFISKVISYQPKIPEETVQNAEIIDSKNSDCE